MLVHEAARSARSPSAARAPRHRDFERTLLAAAMEFTGGHKQEAARRLGWGRNTLARKLKELGVE